MPTITVVRDRLFEDLGREYTKEEFEDLCFEFGIELDDVKRFTTEDEINRKEKHLVKDASGDGGETLYKIEVPANRYDLLCLEGLVQALRVFLGEDNVPNYRLVSVPESSKIKMHVKRETASIRKYVVCAVLRGIKFDETRYKSFIDLQDRLHQNICRRRTLVAIGTHDLDTLEGPFTYEALPPSEINFVPLKQDRGFRADELMDFYKSDMKLKKFLHIIESSPVYPVIFDRNRVVLSLPPIINGAHSAISLKTKNVFIECTATDLKKANIVLNTMVTMFSVYCEDKYSVESVEVIYPDGETYVYPDLSDYWLEAPLSYITRSIGVDLAIDEVTKLLCRMQLRAESCSKNGQNCICVSVPPTRSDILHACDVMEDVAIAYGFNKIPRTKPASSTQGRQQPLNHISDLIRMEIAMAGFTEVLTWILCSHKEIFSMINKTDDSKTAVVIGNPRGTDFEVVRTRLMPGILKTVGHNKDHPRPIMIFEVGDVVLLDPENDVGASNRRHLAALFCDSKSGFEVIHGLLDRIMEVFEIPFVEVGNDDGYYIKPSQEAEFFPGRQAEIISRGEHIGNFGIVHPEVLAKFDIPDPCSLLELDVEHFLHHIVKLEEIKEKDSE